MDGPLIVVLLLTVLDWRFVAGLLIFPALIGVLVAYRLEFDEREGTGSDEEGAIADRFQGTKKFLRQTKVRKLGGDLFLDLNA